MGLTPFHSSWSMMMLDLRQLADKAKFGPYLDQDDANGLEEAAKKADSMATDIESLIDGQDDELAALLGPVAEFLRELSGSQVVKG